MSAVSVPTIRSLAGMALRARLIKEGVLIAHPPTVDVLCGLTPRPRPYTLIEAAK